ASTTPHDLLEEHDERQGRRQAPLARRPAGRAVCAREARDCSARGEAGEVEEGEVTPELERAFALYFDEIARCRASGLYLALLHLLVALPDVCAALINSIRPARPHFTADVSLHTRT